MYLYQGLIDDGYEAKCAFILESNIPKNKIADAIAKAADKIHYALNYLLEFTELDDEHIKKLVDTGFNFNTKPHYTDEENDCECNCGPCNRNRHCRNCRGTRTSRTYTEYRLSEKEKQELILHFIRIGNPKFVGKIVNLKLLEL